MYLHTYALLEAPSLVEIILEEPASLRDQAWHHCVRSIAQVQGHGLFVQAAQHGQIRGSQDLFAR